MEERKEREDKIQTGLRIPDGQYQRLTDMSDRMGISLNALILVLVEIGLNQLEHRPKE